MIKLRRRPESFGMSYVLVQNKIAFLLNQHRLTIACFYNQRNKNLIVNGIYQNWATVRKKKSIIHPGRSFLTIEPHPSSFPPPPPPHPVSSRTPCGFSLRKLTKIFSTEFPSWKTGSLALEAGCDRLEKHFQMIFLLNRFWFTLKRIYSCHPISIQISVGS